MEGEKEMLFAMEEMESMPELEIGSGDLLSHVSINIAAGSNEPESATSDAVVTANPTTDVNMIHAIWLSKLGLRLIVAAVNISFLSSGSVPQPLSAAYYAVLFSLTAVNVAVLVIVFKAEGRPALAKFAKRTALVVVVLVPLLAVATKVYAVLLSDKVDKE